MEVTIGEHSNIRISEIFNAIQLVSQEETIFVCERDGHFELLVSNSSQIIPQRAFITFDEIHQKKG